MTRCIELFVIWANPNQTTREKQQQRLGVHSRPRQELERGPPVPESTALSIRAPHLPSKTSEQVKNDYQRIEHRDG